MSEKFMIQIDDEVVEASGEALQAILDARAEEQARVEAEAALVKAKESALAKLSKLGLSAAEIDALIGS